MTLAISLVSSIDWNNHRQLGDAIARTQIKLFQTTVNRCNTRWKHLMGLPLATADFFLTLVKLTARIVEPLIKGLGNIVGGLVNLNGLQILRGVGYILYTPIVAIGATLIGTVSVLAFSILPVHIVWCGIDPDHYCSTNITGLQNFKV